MQRLMNEMKSDPKEDLSFQFVHTLKKPECVGTLGPEILVDKNYSCNVDVCGF